MPDAQKGQVDQTTTFPAVWGAPLRTLPGHRRGAAGVDEIPCCGSRTAKGRSGFGNSRETSKNARGSFRPKRLRWRMPPPAFTASGTPYDDFDNRCRRPGMVSAASAWHKEQDRTADETTACFPALFLSARQGQPSSLSWVRSSKSVRSWRSGNCDSGLPQVRFTIRPRLTAGRPPISLAQRITLVYESASINSPAS